MVKEPSSVKRAASAVTVGNGITIVSALTRHEQRTTRNEY